MVPLRNAPNILKPSYVPKIFGNMELLHALHKDLFEVLNARLGSHIRENLSISEICKIVGDVFFKAVRYLLTSNPLELSTHSRNVIGNKAGDILWAILFCVLQESGGPSRASGKVSCI